ncbi:MAG: peptidase S10 [bacterium]
MKKQHRGSISLIAAVVVFVMCPAAPGRARGATQDPPVAKTTTEPAGGEQQSPDTTGKKADESNTKELSVTHREITVNGQTLRYTATAGYLEIKEESGQPKADLFFVAYERDDRKNKGKWPLTFAFNGGPGAASVFLHLGALGPRRIFLKDEGKNASPPYRLLDNEYTWLNFTDLVFVDPIGTGYSRPPSRPDSESGAGSGEKSGTTGHHAGARSGIDPKRFYSFREDINLAGDFIRLYVTRFGRWSSPKFIAGESYGATRAAELAGFLQDKVNLNLNGLVLISPALDFQTIMFNQGNDLPCSLFLPTYTAAAWYHKKLSPDLQSSDLPRLLKEAEGWAMNEYSLALLKGAALSGSERDRVIEKLARYTSLSPTYISSHNLRISHIDFTRELLRKEHRIIGLLDGRFEGPDPDAGQEYDEYDPSLFLVMGPFGAAMSDYVRNELKYVNDLQYEVLNEEVNRSWNWGLGHHEGQGFTNVTATLREAISKNKYLKVLIAAGYYDLTTPYFATDYTVSHLGLDPGLQGNVTIAYYDVGHQIYVHLPSLKKLTSDVANFMNTAFALER